MLNSRLKAKVKYAIEETVIESGVYQFHGFVLPECVVLHLLIMYVCHFILRPPIKF